MTTKNRQLTLQQNEGVTFETDHTLPHAHDILNPSPHTGTQWIHVKQNNVSTL